MPRGEFPRRSVIEAVKRDAERKALEWALEQTQGDYNAAAGLLGISRDVLYVRCRKLGMDTPRRWFKKLTKQRLEAVLPHETQDEFAPLPAEPEEDPFHEE